ncbi:MAG: ADP-ribosylglycohydrolase family protein, partial [Lachnospiraceae bacterium]|nr:ADP-ribosylglycohydrolase family protein [Lachnospiraceae bacterium]
MSDEIRNRIRGCLLGGAAGDALGYAIEFRKEDQIFAKYGKTGITEYELDPKSGKAVISDDTQMVLFTANGLLYGDTRGALRGIQGPPCTYVAKAYEDWLLTQSMNYAEYGIMPEEQKKKRVSWLMDVPELFKRRAPGNTCLSALEQRRSEREVTDDYLRLPINTSKGCGGIMRVAPIALAYPKQNPEDIDIEAAQISAITHGHSLGYMPSAVLAHILQRIVFPEKEMSLKEIVLEAKAVTERLFRGDEHLNTLLMIIDRAVRLSENGDADLDN